MGDTARALGVGPEIDFEGKAYRLSPLTYELQAQFETWLERRAFDAVRRQKPHMAAEEYERRLDGVTRDVAAGVYSFGMAASVQAAASLPGLKELLRLSLGKAHPEVDAAFVDRLTEAKLKEAAEALRRANHDPLPTPPPPGGG